MKPFVFTRRRLQELGMVPPVKRCPRHVPFLPALTATETVFARLPPQIQAYYRLLEGDDGYTLRPLNETQWLRPIE